jgi:hypothetical protein
MYFKEMFKGGFYTRKPKGYNDNHTFSVTTYTSIIQILILTFTLYMYQPKTTKYQKTGLVVSDSVMNEEIAFFCAAPR